MHLGVRIGRIQNIQIPMCLIPAAGFGFGFEWETKTLRIQSFMYPLSRTSFETQVVIADNAFLDPSLEPSDSGRQ